MENKNQFWIGAFITILMIGSGFGVAMYKPQNGSASVKYKDYKFIMTSSRSYKTFIDGVQKEFPYLPQEVENINLSQEIKDALSSTKEIDISSNSNDVLKSQIAVSNLFFQENLKGKIYVRTGFTNENPYNKTIITCKDSSANVPVIILEYAENGSISNEGNCIFIRASSPEELIKDSTRIIYEIYGII